MFKYLKHLFLIPVTILLIGCDTSWMIRPTTVKIEYVRVPEFLTAECKPTEPLSTYNFSKSDTSEINIYLTDYIGDLYKDFYDCSSRMKKIREFNYKSIYNEDGTLRKDLDNDS